MTKSKGALAQVEEKLREIEGLQALDPPGQHCSALCKEALAALQSLKDRMPEGLELELRSVQPEDEHSAIIQAARLWHDTWGGEDANS